MLDRRSTIIWIAALCALPQAALADHMRPYASANFDAAKAAGEAFVIHVDATWCPTCKAQKPVLAKLLAEPRFARLKAFHLDYDSERLVMRKLDAMDRSTILVWKGGKEVARATGVTDEKQIAALLEKAL